MKIEHRKSILAFYCPCCDNNFTIVLTEWREYQKKLQCPYCMADNIQYVK